MMAGLTTPDFLNNEIGKLGSAPKFELPEEFKSIWAPTGLSLEEINRRKNAIRQIQQELNTGSQTVATANSGAAATDHVFASSAVPKNKKWFVYAAELTFYNLNQAAAAWCNAGIYPNSSATANRMGLITMVLPANYSGWNAQFDTATVSFPIPILMNEGDIIGIQRIFFQGEAQLRIFYWEEDKDIIV